MDGAVGAVAQHLRAARPQAYHLALGQAASMRSKRPAPPPPSTARSVLLAKHTPTLLAPSSWKLPGSHSTSKLHCSAPFFSRGEKIGPMNVRVFIVVAVILLFKNAETPGAFLRRQVGGQGLRGGGLGGRLPGHRVEILPDNPLRHPELGLHYISGHFDMVYPATRLLVMERLTYCKCGTPYRKQTRLWTNMRWRPRRSLQPLRGVAGRQAPPGRAAGAAADGGAVREGQPITRAALQRSCRAVRGDCAQPRRSLRSG